MGYDFFIKIDNKKNNRYRSLYQQLYADEVMENLPVVNLEDQEEVESFSRYLLGLLEENLDAV